MNKFILVVLLALSCCINLNSTDYQCVTSDIDKLKMYAVSLGQVEIKPIAVIYKERI